MTEPPLYVCVLNILCLYSSVEVSNVISTAKESRNTRDRYCQISFAMLLNYLLNKCFKNISDWRHGCVLCRCIFWIYSCLFFHFVACVVEQSRFTNCLDRTSLGGNTSIRVWNSLGKLDEWPEVYGMQFSKEKHKIMPLGRSNKFKYEKHLAG